MNIEEVIRQNDSVTKYLKQSKEILHAAPLTQWPSILLYMVEVLVYRWTGRKLRRELDLDLYGLKFVIRAHNMDLGMIYEIFSEAVYSSKQDFIPQNGWTCIDVGANIGCVSLAWGVHNRNGKIFAIEPHPATFERLNHNVAANGFLNIACFNYAVDRQSGMIDFLVSDDTSMGVAATVITDDLSLSNMRSRYGHSASGNKSCYQVPARSLDDFFRENQIALADLLKIDIEGHEVACLQGSSYALQRTRRLILEFHSPALGKACRDILTEAGFSLDIAGLLIFATNARLCQ